MTEPGERAGHLARSVAEALRAAGIVGSPADLVMRSFAVAMEPRLRFLDDEHHPAYLHPGRSALILLRDVGPSAEDALALAAIHESADETLRVETERVRAELGDRLADARLSLPLPGAEDLLERLIVLDAEGRLAALAERLDQLRHLHLRGGSQHWPSIYEETRLIWLPVACRTHPVLGRRFGHWVRTFAKRLG